MTDREVMERYFFSNFVYFILQFEVHSSYHLFIFLFYLLIGNMEEPKEVVALSHSNLRSRLAPFFHVSKLFIDKLQPN